MTEGPPPDTDWVADYARLDLEAALALAQAQGRTTRVLRPGDAMTLDWRPDRLNVYIDEMGGVLDIRAG